jgi:hypothetical protein
MGRKIAKRFYPFASQKSVARVFSLADGRKVESGGEIGRQVFEAVNRKIDSAVEHRVFEFSCEKPLALFAEFGKRDIEYAVASGFDYVDFDFYVWMKRFERGFDPVGLPQSQFAAARSYYYFAIQ